MKRVYCRLEDAKALNSGMSGPKTIVVSMLPSDLFSVPMTLDDPSKPRDCAPVPLQPDDTLLRPFNGCPPHELGLAWNAMHRVAAMKMATKQFMPAAKSYYLVNERSPQQTCLVDSEGGETD